MVEISQRRGSLVISHKSTSSISTEIPKIQSLPKLAEQFSSLNPDLCLARKNYLEEDKKNKFTKFFTSKSPRDISHLLDSDRRKQSGKIFLPNSLEDMRR